jgi:hypothetical protein
VPRLTAGKESHAGPIPQTPAQTIAGARNKFQSDSLALALFDPPGNLPLITVAQYPARTSQPMDGFPSKYALDASARA